MISISVFSCIIVTNAPFSTTSGIFANYVSNTARLETEAMKVLLWIWMVLFANVILLQFPKKSWAILTRALLAHLISSVMTVFDLWNPTCLAKIMAAALVSGVVVLKTGQCFCCC